MIQLEINNRKIGLIEVPEDAYDFDVEGGIDLLEYKYAKGKLADSIGLPPGDYTIIDKGDEITEDVAEGIIGRIKARKVTTGKETFSEYFPDYTKNPKIHCTETAIESLHSLIRFHNLNPETTLVVQIN